MLALPRGFRVERSPDTRVLSGGRLFVGGSPRRVLRLTDSGASAAVRLLAGDDVDDEATGIVGRRLVDAGLAHPQPPHEWRADIAVVVPAYGRALVLDRCLAAFDGCTDISVTVVDDGSPDPSSIAGVAAKHDARVLRLDANAGPASARNAGLRETTASVTVFVDSDAVIRPADLRRLSAHLLDPAVVAVAPRVRPRSRGNDMLSRYARDASPLDMGAHSGRVAVGGAIGYAPSTVLVVRRDALVALGGFDEDLRFGEDVDLVWRLAGSSGTIRYDPTVEVTHDEPETWPTWLSRRHRYGTALGPLARRHDAAAARSSPQAAPVAATALLAAGRPVAAAAIVAWSGSRLAKRLRAAGVPVGIALVPAAFAPMRAVCDSARWLTQLWWPVLAISAMRGRRRGVIAVVVGPSLVAWLRRRPRLDPVRWSAAFVADDVAYGLGVWRGCLREWAIAPVLPFRAVTSATSAGNVSRPSS